MRRFRSVDPVTWRLSSTWSAKNRSDFGSSKAAHAYWLFILDATFKFNQRRRKWGRSAPCFGMSEPYPAPVEPRHQQLMSTHLRADATISILMWQWPPTPHPQQPEATFIGVNKDLTPRYSIHFQAEMEQYRKKNTWLWYSHKRLYNSSFKFKHSTAKQYVSFRVAVLCFCAFSVLVDT